MGAHAQLRTSGMRDEYHMELSLYVLLQINATDVRIMHKSSLRF